MADPNAILLVPTEAGAALLHVGPALRMHPSDLDIAVTRCGHPPRIVFHGRHPDALPLWWDGALVPEGWDRARRVWGSVDTGRRLSAGYGAMRSADLDVPCPSAGQAVKLARALEATGLCRVVLLDLVDGQLRERAP